MDYAIRNRRAVLAGSATAAAGLAAWITLEGGAARILGYEGIDIVQGALPGWSGTTASFEGERVAIESMVGETVQFRGAAGAMAAVIERVEAFAIPVSTPLPAGVRTTGFAIHFLAERAAAPVLDGTLALSRPILGLEALFVVGGSDRDGRAGLTAVIA